MDFSFDNNGNFSTQHASPNGRTPAPTNYLTISTHMNHVHIVLILIIMLVIV
jgi:hypothetical protein